jgi:hypothetical protein
MNYQYVKEHKGSLQRSQPAIAKQNSEAVVTASIYFHSFLRISATCVRCIYALPCISNAEDTQIGTHPRAMEDHHFWPYGSSRYVVKHQEEFLLMKS